MGMPDEGAEAAAQAAKGTAGVAAGLLERLADRIGGKASVRSVFGEPVVCGSVTVIPVARVGFGFGGGAGRMPGRRQASAGGGGSGPAGASEGGGGGGGADARPLGFIEIREGDVRYRPIRDPWVDVVVPLATLAAGLVTPKLARSLARRGRR